MEPRWPDRTHNPVINTHCERCPKKTHNPREFPYGVDKTLLLRLNRLLERTKAKVVLSSSWRCDPVGLLAGKYWQVRAARKCINGWPIIRESADLQS